MESLKGDFVADENVCIQRCPKNCVNLQDLQLHPEGRHGRAHRAQLRQEPSQKKRNSHKKALRKPNNFFQGYNANLGAAPIGHVCNDDKKYAMIEVEEKTNMISFKFKSEIRSFPKKAAVNKKHVEDGPLANVEASLAAHEFGHLANEKNKHVFSNFDVFPFT